MSETISRDPNFRDQYLSGVQPDPEFEAALAGSPQPRFSMPAAPRPLESDARWANTQVVRLR